MYMFFQFQRWPLQECLLEKYHKYTFVSALGRVDAHLPTYQGVTELLLAINQHFKKITYYQ